MTEFALKCSGAKVEHDSNEVTEERTVENKKSTATKITSVGGDVKVTNKKRKNERNRKMATKAVVSQKIDDALNKDIKTYDIVEESVEAAEDNKKKKKNEKSDEKYLKEMKKGTDKKTIPAFHETLNKIKEEEERRQEGKEERIQKEEDDGAQRLKQERKDKSKKKEEEREPKGSF